MDVQVAFGNNVRARPASVRESSAAGTGPVEMTVAPDGRDLSVPARLDQCEESPDAGTFPWDKTLRMPLVTWQKSLIICLLS